GGSIKISVNSNQLFEINPGGVSGANGVEGVLLASGINGGTVSVPKTGLGGIQLQTSFFRDPPISVDALYRARRANTHDAGRGQLSVNVVDSIGLNADAGPGGNFQGGSITLIGSGLLITGSDPLALSANGINAGNGGTITVTNQGAADGFLADIFVESVVGGMTISATSGSRGGNGGTVSLSTGRFMDVNVQFL